MRRCRSSRCRHFYPRPPRGGRRSSSKGNGKACKFLSTPSARRATVRQSRLSGSHQISIHALREEGDTSTRSMTTSTSYFYPRPPRGGRHRRSGKKTIQKHFYPRPPRGGRPRGRGSGSGRKKDFYPRPPRGGRPPGSIARGRPCDFYPRPPRGGRLQRVIDCVQLFQFLSTPSARRATAGVAGFET